jgi:hypothetical protein
MLLRLRRCPLCGSVFPEHRCHMQAEEDDW